LSKALAQEIGRALRRMRRARRLRLRDVASRSGGRFSATGIAGYERGERAISVVRFCELCDLYDVRPDRLLAEALRAAESRPPATIDLRRVETMDEREARLLQTLIARIQSRRGDLGAGTITIREQDLAILATAVDRSTEDLLKDVGAAMELQTPRR
jgi:transcriptional regulator with XRE-family HTH domain